MKLRMLSTMPIFAIIVCLAAHSVVLGGVPFLDDFEDGNYEDGSPVTWERSTPPWDQGDHSIQQGSLVITPPTSGPLPVPGVGNYWETDIFAEGELYHDVSILTRVRALADGPSLVGVGGPDTMAAEGPPGNGVWGFLLLDGPTQELVLSHDIAGTGGRLGAVPTRLSHITEDINLRFTVVGTMASFKAWPDGSPEPEIPQLIRKLPEALSDTEGNIILFVGNRSESVPVAFRFVEVEPEPWKIGPVLAIPTLHYAVRDTDSDGTFDNLGDAALAVGTRATLGEMDSASSNYLGRYVTKFELPDIPNLADLLQRAVLRFDVSSVNAPAGPLSVFHSTSDNDLDRLAADFEDASYVDTGRDLLQPTDVAGVSYELDVTDQVLADLASDGESVFSAFRLQVNEASFFEDDASHSYILNVGSTGSTAPPLLLLTLVPEPSTMIAASWAILLLFDFGRRMQKR